jgi:hypothetical protein
MNKKIMIIIGVAVLVILLIIIWIFVRVKAQSQVVIPVNNQGQINSETPNNQPSVANNNLVKPTGKETKIIDSFEYLRSVYVDDKEPSRKLEAYFTEKGVFEEIVVYRCNIDHEDYGLAEVKRAITICKLEGSVKDLLPLAFDLDKQKCFVGYDEVVKYLQAEIDFKHKK